MSAAVIAPDPRSTEMEERDIVAAVVDQERFLVCAFDRDGRFFHFNRVCEQVAGYSFDELRGRPFYELLILPEERARVRRALDEAWESGLTSENENYWVTRTGEHALLAWVNTPLADEGGGTRCILSIGINLSERSAVEAELHRVKAELEQHVEELHSSRRRIVEASVAARRRIERDLHDGAQQRLVALALSLHLARSQAERDPLAAAETLDRARGELHDALAELRDLARGIHPAVLSERGLPAALQSLADRAPLRVEIESLPTAPLPAIVETAVYFVVSEALQNAARHAPGAAASVSVRSDGRNVTATVADDGPGGAGLDAGSGLRGLADRVEVLDGRFEVDSPPRAGTRLTASIPWR